MGRDREYTHIHTPCLSPQDLPARLPPDSTPQLWTSIMSQRKASSGIVVFATKDELVLQMSKKKKIKITHNANIKRKPCLVSKV